MALTVPFRQAIFCTLLVLSPVPGAAAQTGAPADEITRETLRFARIYAALEQNYVEELNPDAAILNGGIRGMLATLDPFSAFFDQQQFELLQEQARGKALGFGSILYVTPGKVLVLETREGSPSWRAGLGPGDEIVEINRTRLDRLSFDSLIQLLERSRSQPVRLGVIRAGRDVAQDVRLNPAEVDLPTVDKAFLISPGRGYIHLTGFEEKTPQEVVDAVRKLGQEPLRGLLLDLRDNPGGIVDSAVGVSSLFLKPGLTVLTVRGRSGAAKAYSTIPLPTRFDFPLVLLVDGNTASAAEVLVAALQDHDRALIVGEPTYGKGVVESVMGLSEKMGLALTTAQYFAPSGRSIQRPLPGTALDFATSSVAPPDAFHTDDGRVVPAGGGIEPDVTIPPRELDPWVTYLNQRGAFTQFAEEYLTRHGRLQQNFEPDAQTLEGFKDFLASSRVATPEEFWRADRNYLKLRIKTEVFNLEFGLAAGDEIEVRGDPQVRKAITCFEEIPRRLQGPIAVPTQ